jgi:hypothetical protein
VKLRGQSNGTIVNNNSVSGQRTAVAQVVLGAADGSLDDVHHPVGVAGLRRTANAARQ